MRGRLGRLNQERKRETEPRQAPRTPACTGKDDRRQDLFADRVNQRSTCPKNLRAHRREQNGPNAATRVLLAEHEERNPSVHKELPRMSTEQDSPRQDSRSLTPATSAEPRLGTSCRRRKRYAL